MKDFLAKLLSCAVGVVAGVILSSCKQEPPVSHEVTELAMVPGMTIEIENKSGRVRIEAPSELERRYQWDDHDETRTLIPRKERFMGRLGAYDPAPSFVWEFWEQRIVADDSQIDFETMEELQARLYEGSAVLDWVYNNEGLVVGFAKNPGRRQVNISVYQFLLRGEKPTEIPGSRPELMNVGMHE
jgi:hypothetical protein